MSNRNTRREKMKELAKALDSGNLYAPMPDGSWIRSGDTKYRTVTLGDKDAAGAFIYNFLHNMRLKSPEVNVVNPRPSQFDEEHIFPKDMFFPEASQEIIDAPKEGFSDTLTAIFTKYNTPVITFIAGLDRNDAKRVTMTVLKDLLSAGTIALSFTGGISENAIDNFIRRAR